MKIKRPTFRKLLRFGMPVWLVLQLLTPLYGYLQPWPQATSVVRPASGQSLVLIGASYSASYNTNSSIRRVSRSYVLFPSALSQPKSITVTQINDQPIQAHESLQGALVYLASLLVALVGTWWFWFRGRTVQQGIQRDGPASGGSAR